MYFDKQLIDIIKNDTPIEVAESTIELLLSYAHERTFQAGESIIAKNAIDTNLYIVKDGIVRLAYQNDDNEEVTIAFGSKGTLVLSPSSFVMNRPAFYYLLACNECQILVIPKESVEQAIAKSHALVTWLLRLALLQFCAFEVRRSVFNGNSMDRYNSFFSRKVHESIRTLSANFPDVINLVPDKVIASYIGVHPVYFSRMKREYISSLKKSRNVEVD